MSLWPPWIAGGKHFSKSLMHQASSRLMLAVQKANQVHAVSSRQQSSSFLESPLAEDFK